MTKRVFALEHWNSEWEAAFTTALHSYPIGLKLWGKGLSGSGYNFKPKQILNSTQTHTYTHQTHLIFFVLYSGEPWAVINSPDMSFQMWWISQLWMYSRAVRYVRKQLHPLIPLLRRVSLIWHHAAHMKDGRCNRTIMARLRWNRPAICEEKGTELFIRCVPCRSSAHRMFPSI